MIVMKRIFAGLLILCLLCTLAACSTSKDEQHPEHYNTLYNAIGKSMEAALEAMDASVSGLSPDYIGLYHIPVSVKFCGMTFDSIVLAPGTNGWLGKYTYNATLNGDAGNIAAELSDFALSLHKIHGTTRTEMTDDPDAPSFEEVFSPENLSQWLANDDSTSMKFYWVLDDIKTDAAKAYRDALVAASSNKYAQYRENLGLWLKLSVAKNKDGSVSVFLAYETYAPVGELIISQPET